MQAILPIPSMPLMGANLSENSIKSKTPNAKSLPPCGEDLVYINVLPVNRDGTRKKE